MKKIPLHVCDVCGWRWYSFEKHPCPRCINKELDEAAQIKKALVNGHVKTPKHKPNFDKRYLETIRQFVVEAVFALWNDKKDAASLAEIYIKVSDKIQERMKKNLWNREWKVPSKRTVDRRVNEAADLRFYGQHQPTKIIAVTAGYYIPNPCLFDPPLRLEVQS